MRTRRNSRPLDKTRQKLDTDARAGTKRDKKGYKGIKRRAILYTVESRQEDMRNLRRLFVYARTWWNWQTREPQKLVASRP